MEESENSEDSDRGGIEVTSNSNLLLDRRISYNQENHVFAEVDCWNQQEVAKVRTTNMEKFANRPLTPKRKLSLRFQNGFYDYISIHEKILVLKIRHIEIAKGHKLSTYKWNIQKKSCNFTSLQCY